LQKNAFLRAEVHPKLSDQMIEALLGDENFFFSKQVMSGIKKIRLFESFIIFVLPRPTANKIRPVIFDI
jgi:hypothetical protein